MNENLTSNENEKRDSKIVDRRNFLKLALLSTAALTSANASASEKPLNGKHKSSSLKSPLSKYTAKKYSNLLGGGIKEISDEQLKAHFGLYENYVNKINEIETKIKAFNPDSSDLSPYRALHAEQSFMLNGALLHEFYFGNLGEGGKEPKGTLIKMINRDFGSLTSFLGHLKAVGKVMRGWSIAGFNYRTGKLNVYGLDQHNQLTPSLIYPILVLDVYEHAYMIDYGTDRKKYLDVFVNNINWKPAEERLELALLIPFGEETTA